MFEHAIVLTTTIRVKKYGRVLYNQGSDDGRNFVVEAACMECYYMYYLSALSPLVGEPSDIERTSLYMYYRAA